jgi:hypothetical protein
MLEIPRFVVRGFLVMRTSQFRAGKLAGELLSLTAYPHTFAASSAAMTAALGIIQGR